MTSMAHPVWPNFSSATPPAPLAARRAALLAAIFDFAAPPQPLKADLKSVFADQRAA
jgi:hypothetical protein